MAKAEATKEPRKIVPKTKQDKETPIYRAICHTKCYWMDTLWEEGDAYEGTVKPCKHFSKDGTAPDEDPKIRAAADDPRSTSDMLTVLKRKFGVDPPLDENGQVEKRQVIFELLRSHEQTAMGGGGIKAKK